MEPLDVCKVSAHCLGIISRLISLIQSWKNKDEYMKIVREFLNSLGDTIEKYQQTNFSTTKQLSFDKLKLQLSAFETFLSEEKKKNPVIKFLIGSDFIRKCDRCLLSMERLMLTMQLDVAIYFGKETATNFKETFDQLKKMRESTRKSKSAFKDEFENANAATFWIKHFENKTNVDLKEFCLYFKAFVYATERKELSDKVLKKIVNVINSEGKKLVNFRDLDYFYEKIWSRFDGKSEFLEICEKSCELPPLTLIYKETNKETNNWATKVRPYDFPRDHEFVITQNYYKYQKIDFSMIKTEKDLVKNPLLVGRDKDFSARTNESPDIAFDPHIKTMSKKQFQITAKNKLYKMGYYITDLSQMNPTKFLVRNKPYALSVGMLIELNNTYLFEIQEVYPMIKFEETENDFITTFIDSGDKNEFGVDETFNNLKISKIQIEDEEEKNYGPSLKLRIMNPLLPPMDADGAKNTKYINVEQINKKIKTKETVIRENENFCLTSEGMGKNTVYSIGGNIDNQIIIKDEDCEDFICQFYFDHKKKGWFVVENHHIQSSQKEHSSAGIFIYLKSFKEYKQQKCGSIGYRLRDGMDIFFNLHVFNVKIQH